MNRFFQIIIPVIFFSMCCMPSAEAQFKNLKKRLKDAAESAGKSVLGGEEQKQPTTPSPPDPQPASSSSTKGKKLTPPKVSDHLGNANLALGASQFSNARFEVKEATRGVELEIGYEILATMPKTVSGLTSSPDEDGVYSTGIGFVGLVISRRYGSNGKRITGSIGDNSIMGASYSMMLNSSYASNDNNRKNVTIQGNRGVVTFDGNNTYKLGVPLAQTSIFVLECRECSGEEDLMDAADNFELANFTSLLTNSDSEVSTEKSASAYLSSASSNYSSKDLQATRFDLQQTLIGIDVQISKMILDMLPKQLGGMEAVAANDEHVATSAGFAGVYIKRMYESVDRSKSIEINLIDDSPLMGAVGGFLSSPLLVGMSGKKTISIDGYKGMYEQAEREGSSEFKINIPFNQSMLSMIFVGLTESDVNKSANDVPVGDVFAVIK